MNSIIRLALHSEENAKVTPLEVLQDFADATTGWVYLEEDSHHYSEVKGTPGIVLRYRTDSSTFVDLGFVESPVGDDTVGLAVLDRPDSDTPLSPDERSTLLDTFLAAMQDYLNDRPDHVTLHVERDVASS